MDLELKESFLTRWKKYFAGAELPLTFEYTHDDRNAEPVEAGSGDDRCMICTLRRARKGRSLSFSATSFGCAGGRHYAGFSERLRANIAEFLSCGIEGQLEGERYKKSPEIARAALEQMPRFLAPATQLVFKRWDRLAAVDHPEVVVFFATPDVLAGLFTLAGYDEPSLEGTVITPFGAGCATIIQYPYAEKMSGRHRAVLGLFDVSARPCEPRGRCLTLAVTMERFVRMVNHMDESFLITGSWKKVRRRIQRASRE